MSDSVSYDNGSSVEQQGLSRDTISERRERLAQMIGCLLARTWILESSVSEKENNPDDSP